MFRPPSRYIRSIISAKPPWFAAAVCRITRRRSTDSAVLASWACKGQVGVSVATFMAAVSVSGVEAEGLPCNTPRADSTTRKLSPKTQALNESVSIRNSDMGICLVVDRRQQATWP